MISIGSSVRLFHRRVLNGMVLERMALGTIGLGTTRPLEAESSFSLFLFVFVLKGRGLAAPQVVRNK